MRSHRPTGFTLIELMIVTAIIGILASIAIPELMAFQLRSKKTERAIATQTIHAAIEDYYVREGRFPQGTPEVSDLTAQWNPPWPPTSSRRAWNRAPAYGPDWGKLTMQLEGNLFYSYYAIAHAEPGTRYRYVYAYGDLDGDRRYNFTYRYVYHWGTGGASQVSTTDYDSALFDATW